MNNGGCWNKDYYVGPKRTHFTACQDNIKQVQVRGLLYALYLLTLTCGPSSQRRKMSAGKVSDDPQIVLIC